jgi:flagellar hook-associated protein 3 FlgL
MTFGVSTRNYFDRSNSAMAGLTQQAERLQTQISTGKKLQVASDDSVGYQRLQVLKRTGADEVAYGDNIKIAQATLQQADTQLDTIATQIQQATERALRGANDTLSANDRKSLATELKSILETIVSATNVKDARGQSLFGGQAEEAAATLQLDGSLVFATGKQTAIPIGDGQSVEPSVSAGEVLKIDQGRDIGQVLTSLIASLDTGAAPTATDRDDLAKIAEQVTQAQTSVGARAVRVDLQAAYYTEAATQREDTRSAIEDVDATQAITELQKTMTILQATQASFSKLSQLSLFDYLR